MESNAAWQSDESGEIQKKPLLHVGKQYQLVDECRRLATGQQTEQDDVKELEKDIRKLENKRMRNRRKGSGK